MPHRAQHSFGVVSTCMQIDQGIATITIDGVVEPQTAPAFLARCDRDLGLLQAQALVALYDSAALQVDANILMRSAMRAMATDGFLRVPTALVIRPEDAEMWTLYCDLQARNGVMRRSFTSVEKAQQWASQQAALWAAQARFRAAER